MRLATLGALRLPNHSIRLMARMLEDLNYDARIALRAADLSPEAISDPQETVTGAQEVAFQRAFMQATASNPALWVELGSRYRLLSHGHSFYGLMMSTAETVQAGLEIGQNMGDLYYMLAQGEGIYRDGRMLGFRSFTTELPPDLRRFCVLRDVGVNCVVLSDLWGESPFPFTRVELPLNKADEIYVRRFLPDCELVFDAECSVWTWTVDLTARRPPQSDPLLHEYYREACEMVVREAQRAGDLLARVTGLLAASRQQIGINEAAQQLGLSIRTFQRQLKARGVNYRALAALNRHQLACRLLSETRSPVSRIAIDVGYDNVSSFNFAFRHHAGMSPTDYRRGRIAASERSN